MLDQVKSAYYSTTDGLAVKSSDYKDNTRESLFCLNGYSIDWDNPFYINSEYGVSVNIPVSTDKQYILKMEDGLGPYVSQLFCSISAIKSKKTCEIRFYYHFLIPLRESLKQIESCVSDESHIVCDFNCKSEGFSGLEIWTDFEGQIIKMEKYFHGKRYKSFFAGNGEPSRRSIKALLSLYLKGYWVVSDCGGEPLRSSFTCPQCGGVLSLIEIGYVCWNCGWNEFSGFDGGLLDPGIIIVEQNDSFNDDNDETLIPGNGGGGGDGFGGGDDNGGGCGGLDINQRDSLLNEYTYNDDAEESIRPTMELLLDDCLGTTIINNVSDMGIAFEQELNVNYIASFRPQSNRIVYFLFDPPISPIILIEELFHAFQKKNGLYASIGLTNINVEIEAKMVAYLYACQNGCKDLLPRGYLSWDDSFGSFLDCPTETNYNSMVDFIRVLGYTDTSVFPDYSDFHIMDNLAAFIGCNDYVSSITPLL